ncbi:MAG TPA: OmpA family protein [Steroidobacteraceae bacterium]|nr:OmpA family protein [Steroidobacteraceae bacterium]
MKLTDRSWTSLQRLAAVGIVSGLLAACAPTPVVPEGAVQARADLTRLQSDAKLAPLAPEALREAEAAVQLAEQTDAKPEIGAHRVYVAQRKVDIAEALAAARFAEQERTALAAEVDRARLEAREREAAAARSDAQTARMEADTARMEATVAQQQTAELQREIDAMNARPTDRGLVLTLGDVLFATGRADLKTGAITDLDQLARFLAKYPDRTVTIEGHTDSVGGEDYNVGLSHRRAESVRSYLLRQGIDASRITTQGMGESVPVASNDTAGGRQQNRRVEIIVSNPPAAAM